MFTDEDYKEYFDQIARVERKMIYGVYDLSCEIDDPFVTRVLKKIGEDEVRHYGYILKMLKEAGSVGRTCERREVREHSLGTIQLRKPGDGSGDGMKASCVNMSKAGVCLECDAELVPGDAYELTIHLFGKEEAMTCLGKVIWNKEVEPGRYVSGVVFDR